MAFFEGLGCECYLRKRNGGATGVTVVDGKLNSPRIHELTHVCQNYLRKGNGGASGVAVVDDL